MQMIAYRMDKRQGPNVLDVLVSSAQQSDLVIHTYLLFLRFFSRIGNFKPLGRVAYARHEVLGVYLF